MAPKRPRPAPPAGPIGGVNQRIARARARNPQPTSKLATLLIEQWSWGQLSTPMIQKLAAAAKEDMTDKGVDCPWDLNAIASLGSNGVYTGNMHRDLIRQHLQDPIFRHASSLITLWIKENFLRCRERSQTILYPHELFAAMFSQGPEVFERLMIGENRANLSKFWQQISETERFESHPASTRADYREKCIPIGLHGDGVVVTGVGRTWSKTCDVFSWTSILNTDSSKLSNYLIFLLFHRALCVSDGRNTMAVFWRHLRWSLWWLWRGLWPTEDANGIEIRSEKAGTPLAGGWYATVWLVKGDLEYFAHALKLESISGRNPCIKCRCNISDTPWTDFHPVNASWLTKIWQAREWRVAHPDIPCILSLPGISIDAISPDWMHTKHLGTDAYLYASVLMLLVHRISPLRRDQAMEDIWAKISAMYHRFGIRDGYSEIRFSMFEPGAVRRGRAQFPCMKGKAAEIKSLCRPLLEIWTSMMDGGDRQHRQVRIALMASMELEDLMRANKHNYRFFGDDAARFKDNVYKYVGAVSALGSFYHPKGEWMFHYTIKYHYLLHLGLLAKEINPRISWCYQGEDMMAKAKTLVQSCSRGTAVGTLVGKVMEKYIIGLSFAVMGQAGWWRQI